MFKKFFILLARVALLFACQESLENRAARESDEYTRKFCPVKINDNTTLDSLTFDIASHTFTRYFSIVTDSQSIQRAEEKKAYFAEELIKEVKLDTSLKPFKENGYAFRFVYRSADDPSFILYDKTVTKEEY